MIEQLKIASSLLVLLMGNVVASQAGNVAPLSAPPVGAKSVEGFPFHGRTDCMNVFSYHGPVDLMLRYGEVPRLTRIAERPAVEIELEVKHPGQNQEVKVNVGSGLRLDLAKGPT